MKGFAVVVAALALLIPAKSMALLELDLGFEPTEVCPGDDVQFFFALENVGGQEEIVELCVTLSWEGQEFGPFCGDFPLAAGEPITHEFAFPVPPQVPAGTLTVYVTATDSGGMVEDSATLTILECRGARMGANPRPLINLLRQDLKEMGLK